MRRALSTLAAIGILAASCSSDDPAATDSVSSDPVDDVVIEIDGKDIVLTSGLSGFADCNALLDHLRAEGAERVGPYGFNDGWYGGWWPGGPMVFEDEPTAEFDTSASSRDDGEQAATANLAEGVDFSGTNVQEGGVDEADAVKTDGERIFIVANGELVVVDVATRSVVGTVPVPSGGRAELFISGDDVLLINQGWGGQPIFFEDDYPTTGGIELTSNSGFDGSQTKITRLTVAGNSPRIIETLAAEGDYVSARAVDGVARIIVRSNPQYNFPFVFPQSDAGNDVATEANRSALENSSLDDWLPSYRLIDANGDLGDEGQLVPCEQVHAPTTFAGFGVLSVLTVDVDGDLNPGTSTAVLAPGEVVYASPDSVYVATTAWFDLETLNTSSERIQENITTSIHRFDIGSDTSAAYSASGSVDGLVRDSFSFSEHDGYLRVVTTTGNTWDETSESWLRVLQETDGELVEVGSVGNMGNGEAVQSVRFQGDVGYVVTFRQVDPLYTIDLSEPTNPVIRGELKIPGFSSYLHPIGDGLVLGVGSDADEQSGQVTGSKVSLFDVSDLDNPLEIDTWIGPDSWNNVGWDTHAFLWWAPERVAAVPINTWNNSEQWAGIVLLRVEDGTITEVGRIDHADPNSTEGDTDCRAITGDDLPTTDMNEFQTEFEYMVVDGYGLVLDCADGQARTAVGFQCNDEPWVTDEAENLGVDVSGTLVTCWREGNGIPQISRSLVLPNNELWTVSSPWGQIGGTSPARLQVNDLSTLDRLDEIEL